MAQKNNAEQGSKLPAISKRTEEGSMRSISTPPALPSLMPPMLCAEHTTDEEIIYRMAMHKLRGTEGELQPRKHQRCCGTVLVVEDEDIVREITVEALESLGYTALQSVNGRIALEEVKKRGDEIDLVLMDMGMPEMDGRDAFRLMRKHRPTIRIVLFSGFADAEEFEVLMNEGLAGYLRKPFRLADLAKIVAECIGRN